MLLPAYHWNDFSFHIHLIVVNNFFPNSLFSFPHSCKLDVRTRGLTVFFEVIKTYGSGFVLSWWVQIFKLIFSIFEHGRDTSSLAAAIPTSQQQRSERAALERSYRKRLFSGDQLEAFGITYRIFTSPTDRSEWLNTTCNHALYSVVDIFSQFFDEIGGALLGNEPVLFGSLKLLLGQ